MKTIIFYINTARPGRANTADMRAGCAAGRLRAATAVRFLTVLLAALLMIVAALPAMTVRSEATTAPELYGDAAVLINADTGEILYDKNRMRQMYPASTTKIMTVLLALENLDLNSMITVSAAAEAQDGSELGLVAGEQISVRDAAYATMLLSANDAAWALAEAVSGDVESFAKLMNEKAADLGAMSTYFVTPNGLPNDSHVTSPMDMARFAQEAMKNETFREIVGTYQYTVAATNMSGPRQVTNTNRLLFDLSTVSVYGNERTFKYEGCTGVKTGHTNAAGYCLVASAERNGAKLIGVVFHSTEAQIYPDMIKLLDYGFTGYAPRTIVKAGDVVGQAKVEYGSSSTVDVTTKEDVVAMVEADANGNPVGNLKGYSYTLNIFGVKAPVAEGEVAGTLTLYNGAEEVGTFDLVTTESVGLSALQSMFKSGSWVKGYVLMAVVVVVASVLGYLWLTFQMRRSAKKQRERRRKKRMMKRIQEQREEAAAAAALEAEAARKAAEEAAKDTPVEEGDLSRMNLFGADEMPDFGDEPVSEEVRKQVNESMDSVRASMPSSPDRVSSLFGRIQAEQTTSSTAAGATATPTQPATGAGATMQRPAAGTTAAPTRPATGTTATPTRPATGTTTRPAAGTTTTTPRPAAGTTAAPTRPATGTAAAPNRPAGTAATPSRPATGTATTPRPAAGTTATPTRPATGTTTTPRPSAGTTTTPTRPAGTTTTARPAGTTTMPNRPPGTTTIPPRPTAGTTATPARPATGTTAAPTRPSTGTTPPARSTTGTATTTPRPAAGTTATPARPATGTTTTPRPAAGTTATPARPATGTTTTTPRPAAGTTATPTRPAGTTTTARPAGTTTIPPRPSSGTTATPTRPATGQTAAPTRPATGTTTTPRPAGTTATPTRPATGSTATPRPATGTTAPTRPATGTTATPRPAGTTPARPSGTTPTGGNRNNNN